VQKIYSVEEVAEILGVHCNTVRRMLMRGELKGVKIGRLWRINEDDLKEILAIGEGALNH